MTHTERLKHQEEMTRLQRLLADQSKVILQRNSTREETEELYRLKTEVMSLDRNLSPAVRELQRTIIQREKPQEYGDYSMGGSAPPMQQYQMRASMPEQRDYRDHGADRNLYGTSDSSVPGLYCSLPKNYGQSQPLARERTDSSLMDAYR